MTLLCTLLLCAQGFSQMLIQHPWAGKRVAYFGDSIIDPGNSDHPNKYWSFLQEWLGITPYVYGVSGNRWRDISRQADKLLQEHGNDFDAILIMMGTNDFNHGLPIGQWWTEKAERVEAATGDPKQKETRMKRLMVYTDSTYCGSINKAMALLKRRWPTKQIVLLTTTHRGYFYAGDRNVQPSEEYQNQIGEYFSTYIEKVKEAANIWAVPVIDLNATSGLYPLFDEGTVYYHKADIDRLHPNDAGHRRLASTLVYQLLALPCSFAAP